MNHINLYENFDTPSIYPQDYDIFLVNGWDYSNDQAKKSLGDGIYLDMEFNNYEDLMDILKKYTNSGSKIYLYNLENSKIMNLAITITCTLDIKFLKRKYIQVTKFIFQRSVNLGNNTPN